MPTEANDNTQFILYKQADKDIKDSSSHLPASESDVEIDSRQTDPNNY